ncbi:PDZ domain-containing protein [Candidatus Nitronereus thalassa]|uniref:PDZ domain-containing protein n=1 Tax=Candidatus Nitronereus thalassa TaxID=3020898 RepID=A0ABU3K963_9BACT|nr:PDZ domain-containing protein [Candidatus Nitronereus thalassa]MDT7042921.1 PDZ domain-containing protein [Candidatus Nitronereus thalassa]
MRFFLIASILLLSACAPNPFAKFYYDNTGGADLKALSAPPKSSVVEPTLIRGGDFESKTLAMREEGYDLIGHSRFNAAKIDESQALEQGKAVGAEVVVLHSEYTETLSGSLPLSLPNTQTQTTNLSGNVFGSGGSGSYSGTATTQTTGTQTTYIPYNVRRYDYTATFWVKGKEPVFGVKIRDLKEEERQLIESNKGVVVVVVVKGSPAFNADVLRGDIIRQIGEIEIIDRSTLPKVVEKYAGKGVDVLLLRNGEKISKHITLNLRK